MEDLKAKNDAHENYAIACMSEYPDVFPDERRRETIRRILGDPSDYTPDQIKLMTARAAADVRGQRLAGTDAASVQRRAWAKEDAERKEIEDLRTLRDQALRSEAEAEIRRKAADAKVEAEREEAIKAEIRSMIAPFRAEAAPAPHAVDPTAIGLRFHG
jgi:ethanolamine ammonia-lyase large subunit